MKTMKLKFVLPLVFLLVSFSANAPKTLTLISSNSSVKVSGTSTLHDWEATVKRVEGNAVFLSENNSILELSSLKANFYSKSFESGKNGMDEKIFDALKADKFPAISFELTKVVSNRSVKGGNHIVGTGNLTIAGNTKNISASAFCVLNPLGELIVTGTHTIDMTHYGVAPPKALLGTIVSGKVITVNYSLRFK